MKKQLLSFVFLLFLITQTKAQFIIAGQHGTHDYYAASDTTISSGYCLDSGYSSSYQIDMNGDGIMDFELSTFCQSTLSLYQSWFKISPFNGDEIAFGYRDSACYTPLAHPFNDNDTINNNRIWMDSTLYLEYEASGSFINGCLLVISDSGYLYLGVRVFLAQDTLYGWIKVNQRDTITIESYACNLGITGINEYQNNSLIKLCPNPATNRLTIHTSSFHNEAVTVSVMNVLGQETSLPTPLQRRGEDAVIDVSNFSAGIYFVQLATEKERWMGKFIKE